MSLHSQQKSFLSQKMVIGTETHHGWVKVTENERLQCYPEDVYISPLLPRLRDHCRRGDKKTIGARYDGYSQQNCVCGHKRTAARITHSYMHKIHTGSTHSYMHKIHTGSNSPSACMESRGELEDPSLAGEHLVSAPQGAMIFFKYVALGRLTKLQWTLT